MWPGARLKAVEKQDFPSMPRARFWMPLTSPTDPQEILRIISNCNPSIPTRDWRVIKFEEPIEMSRQVVLTLNRECLKPLEEAGSQIQFGFTKIPLRVYSKDKESNIAVPAAAAVDVTPQTAAPLEGKTETKEVRIEDTNSEVLTDLSDCESLSSDFGESFSKLLSESQFVLSDEDSDRTMIEVNLDESPSNKPPS